MRDASRLTDEAIRAPLIQLVDPASGQLSGPYKPRDILSKIDRREYILLQVTKGELELSTPKGKEQKGANEWSLRDLPICRLISKRQEYARQREKKKTTKSSQPKVLQLTWNVTGNDLAHKIAKARGELERGQKLRAVILSKKGTRRALPGSEEDERRTRLVDKVIEELCAPLPDTDERIARVTHGPVWKNARTLVEIMLEGYASKA